MLFQKDSVNSKSHIVHIVRDEKFIDMAYRQFEEAAPGKNRLIAIGKPHPLRFVKSTPIEFLSVGEARRHIASADCEAVVLHSLLKTLLVPGIPSDKTVIWLGWGFDYYDRLLSNEYPNGLLLPETKKLTADHNTVGLNGLLQRAVRLKKACESLMVQALGYGDRQVLERVDYFAPVLDTEYEMAARFNPWFKPAYIEWNYGTVENDLGGVGDANEAPGENILVGNSAEPANNHLEVFALLKRYADLSQRQIIVPLSYGENWYKQAILKAGREMFGDRFVPLMDFLDKETYANLLQSCGYVFINSLRQLAMANICIAMLNGSKIFLNSANPAYSWLSSRGCILESISKLSESDMTKYEFTPLTWDERARNSHAVTSHWGREAQRIKTKHLVALALKRKKVKSA